MRGEKYRPSLRADLTEQRVKALLDERIEPRSRLVENQQLGLVHERLDQPELLPVPGGELPHLPVEIRVEALSERVAHAPVDAPAQPREIVEHRASGQLRIERQVTRQEADAPVNLDAVAPRIEPEHPRGARSRPDQIE